MSLLDTLEAESKRADVSHLWKGSFRDFLNKYEAEKENNANIGVLAHQRVYNMILAAGTDKRDHFGKDRTYYKFFEETLFGIEDSIDEIMTYIHSAAQKTETCRRMLLMYGPPSSGKSDIIQHLKRGLEYYTQTSAGAIYALAGSKMHENPFLLIPEKLRGDFEKQYGLGIEGQLSPSSAYTLREEYHGKFMDFPIEQIYLDEASRKGIGTWLPQDPKCVSTYSTIVYSNGIQRMSDIFERSVGDGRFEKAFAYLDMRCESLFETEKVKGIYDNGKMPVYEIDYGLRLECTDNHRIMTLDENGDFAWRRLKDIELGTPLLVKSNMQSFGTDENLPLWDSRPLQMSPSLGYILGSLVSEGSCSATDCTYHNFDARLNQKFHEAVKNVFLTECTIRMKNLPETNSNSDSDVIVKTRKQAGIRLPNKLGRWLVSNFEIGCTACYKRVPSLVLKSARETHIEFLEGLYLGDGSIRFKKDKVARATYATCSKILAQDVQHMLLNFGIFSRLHERIDPKYSDNVQYSVCVEGEEVYNLGRLLPKFFRHRKFDFNKQSSHKRRYEYFGSLRGLISDIRKFTKGTRELIDRRYCISTENKRTPVRTSLEKWVHELKGQIIWTNEQKKTELLKKLDLILSYKCVPLKVKKYVGLKDVVDLSCDSETFSYVSNGLISHNSSDQSELVGGIDFAKIQEYGDEADPRTYNFNGELNVANRGIMEFIEGLKADERFLRVLLTATQEKMIKAPRFGLIYCDTVILLHTNEEEFRNFMAEKKYEAYHDRMVIVKVPYNLSVSNEVKIYEKLLSKSDAIKNMHIAPKTLQSAAMFAVLTRLAPPPDGGELTLVKKMKLYDKQHVRGHKVEQVPDMRRKEPKEGMTGVSPRFTIDQISASIAHARDEGRDYITPLDVLRQLNRGVFGRDSFSKDKKNHFEALIDEARNEWDDLLRNDIQKAFFVSYEKEARNLCENYLDQIDASCAGTKPRDPITRDEIDLDEKLMDSVEEQIDITSSGKEDFRNEILRAVGAASRAGRQFDYTQHSQLREAIQKKLFEERKNVIRMTVSTRNPDPDELKRINDVVARMVDQQGYSTAAANALLKYATAHLFEK